MKEKLLKKLNKNEPGATELEERQENGSESEKLKSLKSILYENSFVQFIVDFDSYTNNGLFSEEKSSTMERSRILNLISYKRQLFNSCFLYDLDDSCKSAEEECLDQKQLNSSIKSANGVACDFVLSKFQDFILTKMTNHIINYQSGMVSVNNILNATKNMSGCTTPIFNNSQEPIDLDEEQNEKNDVDQNKFLKLKKLYDLNSMYLLSVKRNYSANKIHRETELILVHFLKMLNNWKLRKFDFKISDSTSQMKNPQKR